MNYFRFSHFGKFCSTNELATEQNWLLQTKIKCKKIPLPLIDNKVTWDPEIIDESYPEVERLPL
jgi:hypothetical protein